MDANRRIFRLISSISMILLCLLKIFYFNKTVGSIIFNCPFSVNSSQLTLPYEIHWKNLILATIKNMHYQ